MKRVAPTLALLAPALLSSCAESPTYMTSAGTAGSREAALGWTLTIISIAVVLLVSVLLVWGLARRRDGSEERTEVNDGKTGLRWIYYGGIAMPIVVLLFAFTYSTVVLTGLHRPPSKPGVHVRVTGHRWWWEMKYLDGAPEGVFLTANELHVPVGVPVHLELTSADVIHSFWVPELAGKTDLEPGRTTGMWIEAKEPGVYLGLCAEFCGVQHAHMQFRVVAETPEQYAAWLANERRAARTPSSPAEEMGARAFQDAPCAGCHTIRGTRAAGRVGPDLTHFGSRRTLGAGMLRNTRGDLAGWIANAQAIKPGNHMPPMYLAPAELRALSTYLESLR